jgi:hypothetical protein
MILRDLVAILKIVTITVTAAIGATSLLRKVVCPEGNSSLTNGTSALAAFCVVAYCTACIAEGSLKLANDIVRRWSKSITGR